ncbi:MAG: hypothetical protein H6R45_721 [Proteobacteria bacterium]|nr:hypothetical protein [Pseudomonadota bacterium]
MLVGAWAIGLHQIVFHPLFAGPFILTLLPQRRFGLFATYAAAYAAVLLFWISYPGLLLGMAGIPAEVGSGAGGAGFIATRVLPLITRIDPYLMALTHYNLLRFIAWSPAFLLPLLAMAWRPVRENKGIALPLFAGIALTLLAMSILLPYQGHGWGYRYFCAVLGNFALLCGYGYRNWATRDRAVADGTVIALGGATALVILPLQLWMAHHFVKPNADLHALISRQTSDFVVVDTQAPSSAIDQVRNLADLSNRPLIFSSADLDQGQVEALCRRGTVTLITRTEFHRVGFLSGPQLPSPKFDELVRPLAQQGCLRPVVP